MAQTDEHPPKRHWLSQFPVIVHPFSWAPRGRSLHRAEKVVTCDLSFNPMAIDYHTLIYVSDSPFGLRGRVPCDPEGSAFASYASVSGGSCFGCPCLPLCSLRPSSPIARMVVFPALLRAALRAVWPAAGWPRRGLFVSHWGGAWLPCTLDHAFLARV